MQRLALSIALALTACTVPGPVDTDAALEVVYDPEGVPAFAGQAMVIRSCGAGAYCHSSTVEGAADRFGAPAGLSFDLTVASLTNDVEEERAERLVADRDRMLGMPWQVWHQVESGAMPPQGEAGRAYFDEATPNVRFERFAADGEASPLPPMASAEGREIFRNWLAAGAPVVERTQERVDREDNVGGFTVPACERECVDATWPDLHARVLVPTCALSRCHDSSEPAAQLDLCRGGGGSEERGCVTTNDPAAVHARVVGGAAMGEQCTTEGHPVIDAGSPDTSLLYLKVAAESSEDICGSRMPLGGTPLTPQRLCALSLWIECGACEDPTDAACAECVEAGRAACNLPAGGSSAGACITTTECSSRLP